MTKMDIQTTYYVRITQKLEYIKQLDKESKEQGAKCGFMPTVRYVTFPRTSHSSEEFLMAAVECIENDKEKGLKSFIDLDRYDACIVKRTVVIEEEEEEIPGSRDLCAYYFDR